MSRKREDFEHRTSIFEAAFRAWSYLGGLEPATLESNAVNELDPCSDELKADNRLGGKNDQDEIEKEEENNDLKNKQRMYPYEPLPRIGLAHPYFEAILSPWLGLDAEEKQIQDGLTTLRTWWQHRRQGQSPTSVEALSTPAVAPVVDRLTRHYFKIAVSLVKEGEQGPRTLDLKMNQGKHKKRRRSETSVNSSAERRGSFRQERRGSIRQQHDLNQPAAGRDVTSDSGSLSGSPTSKDPSSAQTPDTEADRILKKPYVPLLDRLQAAQQNQLESLSSAILPDSLPPALAASVSPAPALLGLALRRNSFNAPQRRHSFQLPQAVHRTSLNVPNKRPSLEFNVPQRRPSLQLSGASLMLDNAIDSHSSEQTSMTSLAAAIVRLQEELKAKDQQVAILSVQLEHERAVRQAVERHISDSSVVSSVTDT